MNTTFDKTSDLNLDGRSLCPGHAHVYPRAEDWCPDDRRCEACRESFWEGYQSAANLYSPYRNDTTLPSHLTEWKMRWTRDLIMASKTNRKRPYWDGYCMYAYDMLGRCQKYAEERESVLKARAAQDKLLGPREFTFTYSPAWFETDEQAQLAMKSAIDKLTKYYSKEIIEFHAVGEYTASGNSHIHAWYHLVGGRKISDKNFKRAWPRWNPKKKLGRGFEGGHHQAVNRLADFAGYIEKHLEESWLIVDINNADHEEEVDHEEEGTSTSQSTPASSLPSSQSNS